MLSSLMSIFKRSLRPKNEETKALSVDFLKNFIDIVYAPEN